jgi:hypothetical protein
MQVLKSQIAVHELLDKCEFCFNGEEAFIKAKEIIMTSLDQPNLNERESKMPVCLLLLDQQMPRMNGF